MAVRGITDHDAWNKMIDDLRPPSEQPISVMWDECDEGREQERAVGANEWTKAVRLLEDKGIVTKALVNELVNARERWTWGLLVKALDIDEIKQKMRDLTGMNENRLFTTIVARTPNMQSIDEIFIPRQY